MTWSQQVAVSDDLQGMAERVVTERALNRALLARQGLLEPMAAPVGDVVAAVGALQMQHWPALGPALWSRMPGQRTAWIL